MNGTSVLEPPPTTATGIGRGPAAVIALALVAGLVFVAGAALPYFTFTQAQYGPYWFERGWLLLHIIGGIAALLSGPVQLWLGLSDRRMGLHRRLGIVYVCAVAVSASAAYYLAFNTPFGWIFGAGLAGLATAWIVTTSLAFLSIRRSLYDQHKEWMVRSYVVTFAFVTFRAMQPMMNATGIGNELEQIAFLAWASWALPLLVTEAVLQGRKILAVR
jgi:hypothetical protein